MFTLFGFLIVSNLFISLLPFELAWLIWIRQKHHMLFSVLMRLGLVYLQSKNCARTMILTDKDFFSLWPKIVLTCGRACFLLPTNAVVDADYYLFQAGHDCFFSLVEYLFFPV